MVAIAGWMNRQRQEVMEYLAIRSAELFPSYLTRVRPALQYSLRMTFGLQRGLGSMGRPQDCEYMPGTARCPALSPRTVDSQGHGATGVGQVATTKARPL